MRVLVVGGGGREHAIAWKLHSSPTLDKLYCAPGNGGIADLAECVPISAEDIAGLADFAAAKHIDLTVVGPEAPLVGGIVEAFEAKGLRVFGPSSAAARLEGSKAFAKEVMAAAGVPTGRSEVFTDIRSAREYLTSQPAPIVIKADGLAAGKGVTVAATHKEAERALEECLVEDRFGEAGRRVLIEECLVGQEVSLLAFTDGRAVVAMVPAQDYKRVADGDSGPNTGGMGCYSPVPVVTEDIYRRIVGEVLGPTVAELANRGVSYKGVIYAGVILTEDGPKVLEFNVRFGDPETQVILPRLTGDLLETMLAVVEMNLSHYRLQWSPDVCVTVVLASGGYPDDYETGIQIDGLADAAEVPGVVVFHAGTKLEDGRVVTAGGRVLNVTARGADFAEARERAYEAAGRISFDGMHYRKDIAERAAHDGGT